MPIIASWEADFYNLLRISELDKKAYSLISIRSYLKGVDFLIHVFMFVVSYCKIKRKEIDKTKHLQLEWKKILHERGEEFPPS